MNVRKRHGFTLIELMVALVVGMLLMASLVALSGSVQRSFGRSKDITDLQGNLRFAMKTLVDDVSRIAFMSSPDPNMDSCHRLGPLPAEVRPSVEWGDPLLDLRGNFASSRDYRLNLNFNQVYCRNEQFYDKGLPDNAVCGGYERYLQPFADGPANLNDIFCPGLVVRLEAEERRYVYVKTAAVDNANNLLQLDPFDRSRIIGEYRWVSPMTRVQYEVVQDPTYVTLYTPSTDAANRWMLVRRYEGCREGALTFGTDVEIGDFLMPQSASQPGMEIQFIEDDNAAICVPPTTPAFSAAAQLVPEAGNTIDPIQARSMIITLRGRTEAEDPAFVITDYGAAAPDPAERYGVDLDTMPDNGLAHVREERTVVQLRNLGLNLNL